MIETFASAIGHLMGNASYLGALIGGCLLGLFFGLLPGLGGTICLALLLPFTWNLDPIMVMYMFSGVMGSVMVGGSVTSILVNIPGTGGNLATIFDGYPMSRKGEAGRAIGIAGVASCLGGLFGIFWLLLLLPVVIKIIMSFAAPEFCTMILVGLIAIVVAARGNVLKGLSMGGVGMLLAFIGFSDTTGTTRYTGGLLYLWDGIGLIPFILGLFAISEVIMIVRRREAIAELGQDLPQHRWANTVDGFKTVLKHKVCFLRSSAMGTVVGIIPGIGGAVATLLAYTAEMQASKHPELFGTGLPEGVLAPESANNAKDGGALLPTVAFGLPGSAEMVMVLAAFIMHGFAPGPTLLKENIDLVVAPIIGITFSNLLSAFIVLAASMELAKVSTLQPYYVAPIVTVLCFVGVFAVRQEVLDIVLVVLLGFFGYGLRRAGFPIMPLVIGFILGGLFEHSLLQSLMISYGSYSIFLTRPIALGLIILSIILLVLPWVRGRASRRP